MNRQNFSYMLIGDNINIRQVHGLSEEEVREICAYLQGAVYCWCNIRKGEWFKAQDFLGGDNTFWQGTPVYRLYERLLPQGHDYAHEQAAKDAGRILKSVLDEDSRTFETREGFVREYRRIIPTN